MSAASTKTARALLEVMTLLMRSFAANLRQGEQRLEPAHVGCLARISHGTCSLTELAQHQAVRLPTMSRTVALLVERGWVERWTPEENRRQSMVRLTADGRRAFAGMRRQAERHVARLLANLGVSERAQVELGLETLIETLRRTAPVPKSKVSQR